MFRKLRARLAQWLSPRQVKQRTVTPTVVQRARWDGRGSKTESDILSLFETHEALTAADINARLDVKTAPFILPYMVKRGLLTVQRQPRPYVYRLRAKP